jgi:Lipopolysaccharide kinase (Kdo/WaaP) family
MKENFWRRLSHGVRRTHRRDDWLDFVGRDGADGIMEMTITDRFHAKQGRSIARWVLQGKDKKLTIYLKRHYRLSRWRGLLATVWPEGGWSPAVQEWHHLKWARDRGLPVPAGVAAGEYIGPWGSFRSFLAVEELSDMLPLHEAVPAAASRLDANTFRTWKRTLGAEMARLTRALHSRRYFHKDLYLCHFYIPRQWTEAIPCWQGQVYLIDFHRLCRHRFAWRFWQMKDLAQLLYSSNIPGVDVQDRVRFWRAYMGSERRSWPAKLLRYGILVKARRYRHHNAKRESESLTVGLPS